MQELVVSVVGVPGEEGVMVFGGVHRSMHHAVATTIPSGDSSIEMQGTLEADTSLDRTTTSAVSDRHAIPQF